MALQVRLLIIIVFLLVGNILWAHDNETQKYYDNRKFDGNFPTGQIRNLWQVCSLSWQANHPQVPQPIRWAVCDCYVDVIRETLSTEELAKLTFEDAKKITSTLIGQCNQKLNKEPKIAT